MRALPSAHMPQAARRVNERSGVLDTPERVVFVCCAYGEKELLALREWESGKWLVVVYREFSDDGFVITAFFTRRVRALEKRTRVWP